MALGRLLRAAGPTLSRLTFGVINTEKADDPHRIHQEGWPAFNLWACTNLQSLAIPMHLQYDDGHNVDKSPFESALDFLN
ncbi:hypothetical protein SCP_0900160 [Sparassis crispa]|uniref:Uncharacterized protein n=1 Tax=Sparassis crispa TaxID=139825 RepID=A0A401GVC6_9APHY|nr:hypothetical protein SCP_0900160 [Sparassis crispa]GBE86139.1 hypothetical protein SCP_0900160 [Sparassis crispa]